jgi:hypothetical protein
MTLAALDLESLNDEQLAELIEEAYRHKREIIMQRLLHLREQIRELRKELRKKKT